MKSNNFSDTITKLATVDQARDRYKLSRTTLIKYAEKNNAVCRIGRAVRIDCSILDKALLNDNSSI